MIRVLIRMIALMPPPPLWAVGVIYVSLVLLTGMIVISTVRFDPAASKPTVTEEAEEIWPLSDQLMWIWSRTRDWQS